MLVKMVMIWITAGGIAGRLFCWRQLSRSVEFTAEASPTGRRSSETSSRLNGGGPWLYHHQHQQQQQQQQMRVPAMANGSARMLLQVPPPPHQPCRAVTAGHRSSAVSRGK